MNRRIKRPLSDRINVKKLKQKLGESCGRLSLLSLLVGVPFYSTSCLAADIDKLASTISLKLGKLSQQIICDLHFPATALSCWNNNQAQMTKQGWENSNFFPTQENLLQSNTATEATTSLIAQRSSRLLRQGREISINGRKFPVAWSQWYQGKGVRTGITDTGAMAVLGLELLSTNNPELQPVNWFPSNSTKANTLKAHFISPYRYLDITDFARLVGWRMQIKGETLTINFSKAQIKNIQHESESGRQRIVLEMDRPTLWQVNQAKRKSAITIEGIATPYLLGLFPPPPPVVEEEQESEEEQRPLPLLEKYRLRLERIRNENRERQTSSSAKLDPPKAPLFFLENSGTKTILRINMPAGNSLRVSSLSNPDRLVVDIRPDALVERDILWAPGVRWRSSLIGLNNSSAATSRFGLEKAEKKDTEKKDLFPVVWLEVNLRSRNINLQPITGNLSSLEGIYPLVTTARDFRVAAAINGGFFNRNNKLPLGAIRRSGRWLSGPILNRGAIAWDYFGRVKIGHLNLEETLITANSDLAEALPILSLNSGYVQRGIARYTKEWGKTYTPLIDSETIVLVENNRVTQQLDGGTTGENSFPIPTNGYLLAIRGESMLAETLKVDTQVRLESVTVPTQFANYPHILGAGPLLLQNGRLVLDAEAEKFSAAFSRQAATRSAIATTNRGTLLIVAIQGAGERGATLRELAQIMQRLGASDALNLDGGSSTSLYLGGQLINRSVTTAARIHNGLGIFISK
ncbi:MAG: phosphodiester glycosidase family protein [Prochloraceae cyanobacterium]